MVARPFALLAVAALPLLGAPQPEPSRAHQLLARSMERTPGLNIVAVVLYRTPDGKQTEQAKVEIARDGRMHRVVLQPLSREGFESVDDGKELKTRVPDHKTILIQESPLLELSDAAFRMRLVDHNYTLKEESSGKVAGRDSITVVAVPRHRDVVPRRFVLDAQSGYLLRMEIGTQDGKMDTRVEVKSIEFPNQLPSTIFQIRTMDDARQIRFPKREDLNQDNPPADIHFKPVVPRHLPGGFVVQSAQINRGRFHSIAVRITDGLMKGTVYESLPADAPPDMKMDGATRVNTGQITFTLVMDGSADLRSRILDAFTRPPGSPGPRGGDRHRHEPPPLVEVPGPGTSAKQSDVVGITPVSMENRS